MPVRKIGSVAVDLALEMPIDEGFPPAINGNHKDRPNLRIG